MSGQFSFPLGVIEGFYGRPWPHQVRLEYASYLQRLGLNSYLYCPKSDPFLRKRWREHWPKKSYLELEELAEVYHDHGIAFGVGLSPFALYQNYGPDNRAALKAKVDSLLELKLTHLAVLFDDMPGDCDSLAQCQAEIVNDVISWSGGLKILVCPTYYSYDPVLEKYFGTMPHRYWEELGRALPAEVGIFWTGNQVCAESIQDEDLRDINKALGRKVILWDNYPVNDGAIRSQHLFTNPLPKRSPGLASEVSGHYCNPMNQPLLSLMALSSLPGLYSKAPGSLPDWLTGVYGAEVLSRIQDNQEEFEVVGLAGMGEERCRELAGQYENLPGPAAREVAQWLSGEFAFDPHCLTD